MHQVEKVLGVWTWLFTIVHDLSAERFAAVVLCVPLELWVGPYRAQGMPRGSNRD